MDRLSGNFALLVTPFDNDGSLHEPSIRTMVDFVVDGGAHGLVALGTTGEFFSLREAERARMAKVVIEQAGKRVPVLIGVGHSATHVAADLAINARDVGADGILLPPPYYHPLSPEIVDSHFRQIARAASLPVMLYDGGGGTEIPISAIASLCRDVRCINSVKVSVLQANKVAQLVQELGDRLSVFCGDESVLMPEMAMGADGMSTASGTVLPATCTAIIDRFRSGDHLGANDLYIRVLAPWTIVSGITKSEFIRCFKETLAAKGVIATAHTRPPVRPLHPIRLANVLDTARALGILGSRAV